MGFVSDGASITIVRQIEVATVLRKIYKCILTSVHCMTHRTNLTAIDATKVRPYINMSK